MDNRRHRLQKLAGNRAIVRLADPIDGPLDFCAKRRHVVVLNRPDRSVQRDLISNDIEPSLIHNMPDGNRERAVCAHLAVDGRQGRDDVSGGDHRVFPEPRYGAVDLLALYDDLDEAGGGKVGADAEADEADGVGDHVDSEDCEARIERSERTRRVVDERVKRMKQVSQSTKLSPCSSA